MNVHLPTHMGKQAFLAWVQGREERYELVDGRVVMMVGASRAHGRIVRNLLLTIHEQIDPQRWDVIADFGLDAGPMTLRYPDIVVDRIGADADYTAIEPALIAEVLSPSTETMDLRDKAAEYLNLPSLLAYLILAQDSCKAWLWVREQGGGFSAEPEIIVESDKAIQIRPLGLRLPFAAIYAGVDVGQ